MSGKSARILDIEKRMAAECDEKVHLDNCRTGRGRAPMKNRIIRVPDDVWEAAQRAADHNDEYLSEAIRRMLERFARGEVAGSE